MLAGTGPPSLTAQPGTGPVTSTSTTCVSCVCGGGGTGRGQVAGGSATIVSTRACSVLHTQPLQTSSTTNINQQPTQRQPHFVIRNSCCCTQHPPTYTHTHTCWLALQCLPADPAPAATAPSGHCPTAAVWAAPTQRTPAEHERVSRSSCAGCLRQMPVYARGWSAERGVRGAQQQLSSYLVALQPFIS